MRKKMVTGMLAVSLAFMMTGCCLSHGWQEATCTEPKTCSKCGETEGEALGHTWEEATCTEPKTCSVCQETEGEALGHTLSEATYWEAAVCSVCGETVGDVLTPAFEELGVKGQFMEVGETYDYNTQLDYRQSYEDMLIDEFKKGYGIEEDYANLTDLFMEGVFGDADFFELDGEMVEVTEENAIRLFSEGYGLTGNFEDLTEVFMANLEKNAGVVLDVRITAQATVTDYQVFDSDETHEAKDGYEWKTVEMQIEYDGSYDKGWQVNYGYDDYYERDEEGDQEDSEYEPGWDNEETHTVNWKGQDYTECRAIIADTSDTGWVEDAEGNYSLTYTAKCDFLYPKGYDGVLLYLFDGKYSGVRPVNFANTDENTLFFRLQ